MSGENLTQRMDAPGRSTSHSAMTTISTTPWLQSYPALSGLEPQATARLLLLQPFRMKKSGILFSTGSRCPGFLLLLSGEVKVSLHGAGGRSVVLYRVHAGETCVQTTLCLFSGDLYTGEGVAETDLLAVLIPASEFDALIAASARFRRFVFARLADRMAEITQVLETVAFVRIDSRLARALIEHAGTNRRVTATHQQLAEETGSVREVISRQLAVFEKNGWVRTGRGSIDIRDMAQIEALARVT
jgi:CRP/FNR family transcriptional regulator, anaerobic regulatory protein